MGVWWDNLRGEMIFSIHTVIPTSCVPVRHRGNSLHTPEGSTRAKEGVGTSRSQVKSIFRWNREGHESYNVLYFKDIEKKVYIRDEHWYSYVPARLLGMAWAPLNLFSPRPLAPLPHLSWNIVVSLSWHRLSQHPMKKIFESTASREVVSQTMRKGKQKSSIYRLQNETS